MIVFDLMCAHSHKFEAWFRSSEDYSRQQDMGLVACPHCGSTSVSKAFTAPNLGRKGNQKGGSVQPNMTAEAADRAADVPAEQKGPDGRKSAAVLPENTGGPAVSAAGPEHQMRMMMRAVKAHMEAHCDNVGGAFAEEARKIHYGDAEARGIYGRTTPEEAKSLADEGIPFMGLPDEIDSDA